MLNWMGGDKKEELRLVPRSLARSAGLMSGLLWEMYFGRRSGLDGKKQEFPLGEHFSEVLSYIFSSFQACLNGISH